MTRLYRCVVVILLLVYVLLLKWRPIAANIDFWAHAAAGRWFCEHGSIPDHSMSLWAGDVEVIYHSWCSEIVFYGLASLMPPATVAFVIVLGIVPFLLWGTVFARSAVGCSWLAVPLVFVYYALAHRLAARPDLFSAILLSVVLLLLARGDRGIYAIPPLFALWANFHGFVAVGLIILAVTLVADLVQDGWKSTRRLAAVCALAVLAVNVNPYGFGYWRIYGFLRSGMNSRISEFLPVWQSPSLDPEIWLGVAIASGLALGAWLASSQRRLSQLAWWLASIALFLRARRNVSAVIYVSLALVALNAAAIQTDRLWSLVSSRPLPFRWLARGAIVAFLCGTIAPLAIFPYSPPALPPLDGGFARFVDEVDLSGARVFNDVENSGYLKWRCRQLPLFVDVLGVSDTILSDYDAILRADASARDRLGFYNVNFVVLTTHRPNGTPLGGLAAKLDRDVRWARVYADDDAIAWVLRADYPELAASCHPREMSLGSLELWQGKGE